MAVHGEQDRRLDPVAGVLAAVFFVTVTPLALGADAVEAASYPLTALAGLAFVWRRRAPLVTLAIVVAAISGFVAINGDGGPVFGSAFLALAALAHARPATRDWLGWTIASVFVLTAVSVVVIGFSLHEVPLALLLLATPRLVADRADARVLREAALEQQTARRLVEERLRIAREVHDVVGHGLATIALRAGVADHVMERDPREAQEALRAIREVSTEALGDLGDLLDVLRAGGERAAALAPVPDLEQVPRLVDGMREAGLAVDLDVEGDAEVSDVVGAAAYRIVQEALTNVARHAGDGARASVRLARGHRAIELEILDDGRGAPAVPRDGRGLAGMRERAAALGGRFEAGPRPDGGFRVAATLPAAR